MSIAPSPLRIIARWETRGRKRFVELVCRDHNGQPQYSYRTDNGGGWFQATTDDEALQKITADWGPHGAGAVTVLRSDFPSLRRVC